jgi:hypothetical protein
MNLGHVFVAVGVLELKYPGAVASIIRGLLLATPGAPVARLDERKCDKCGGPVFGIWRCYKCNPATPEERGKGSAGRTRGRTSEPARRAIRTARATRGLLPSAPNAALADVPKTKKRGGGRRSSRLWVALEAILRERPDATIDELAEPTYRLTFPKYEATGQKKAIHRKKVFDVLRYRKVLKRKE